MSIQTKLTLAFLIIILFPGIATLYVQQSKMEEAIYHFHEQKGRVNAERLVTHEISSMLDAASNYAQFLALDSNIVKATYYAAALNVTDDLKAVLPQIKERLDLSFLEVLDNDRRIIHSTYSGQTGALVTQHATSLSSQGEHHIAEFEFNPRIGRFEIHAESAIIRGGQQIGIVHGGYVLDKAKLATIAGDSSAALFHAATGSFESTGAVPFDQSWLQQTDSYFTAVCGGAASQNPCIEKRFRSTRQALNGRSSLVTATPLIWHDNIIGILLLLDDASQMKVELASARNSTLIIGAVTLSIALLVSLVIAKSLSGPIVRLKEAALAFGKGNLNKRVKVESTDEIGVLGEAFNTMVDTLCETTVSKNYVANIISSIADMLVVTNDKGHITLINQTTTKALGYAADELMGQGITMLVYDSDDVGNLTDKLAHNGTLREYETRYKTKGGRIIPVHVSCARLSDSEDNTLGMVYVARDISERLRVAQELQKEKDEQQVLIEKLQAAQNQLLQSEKMASVGQLAAGVAHEINNPMGFIGSNIHSLRGHIAQLLTVLGAYEQSEQFLPRNSEALERVTQAKKEAEVDYLKSDIIELIKESQEGVTRVKQIVQDLKEFSHVDNTTWQWIDLHKGIDSTLNVARNELKYKVEIIKKYGEIPQIQCLASQLNQVFMNIFVNAAHAIKDQGTITIRTGLKDDRVWIEISDNGKGIDPEHLKRIFEPFFTTKPVGQGTGLGLSLSYGIVKKHGGNIEVESQLEQGTTFRICLPIQHTEEALQETA